MFSSALSRGRERGGRGAGEGGLHDASCKIHIPNMGSTPNGDRVKDRFLVLPGQTLCKFVSARLAFLYLEGTQIVVHVKEPCPVFLTT